MSMHNYSRRTRKLCQLIVDKMEYFMHEKKQALLPKSSLQTNKYAITYI